MVNNDVQMTICIRYYKLYIPPHPRSIATMFRIRIARIDAVDLIELRCAILAFSHRLCEIEGLLHRH